MVNKYLSTPIERQSSIIIAGFKQAAGLKVVFPLPGRFGYSCSLWVRGNGLVLKLNTGRGLRLMVCWA